MADVFQHLLPAVYAFDSGIGFRCTGVKGLSDNDRALMSQVKKRLIKNGAVGKNV